MKYTYVDFLKSGDNIPKHNGLETAFEVWRRKKIEEDDKIAEFAKKMKKQPKKQLGD